MLKKHSRIGEKTGCILEIWVSKHRTKELPNQRSAVRKHTSVLNWLKVEPCVQRFCPLPLSYRRFEVRKQRRLSSTNS